MILREENQQLNLTKPNAMEYFSNHTFPRHQKVGFLSLKIYQCVEIAHILWDCSTILNATTTTLSDRVERAYFAKSNSAPFPEGKVYYLFEEGVRQKTERMVVNAMRKISQNVPCIKFLKVTPANTNSIPHRLVITDHLPGLVYNFPRNPKINFYPFCSLLS